MLDFAQPWRVLTPLAQGYGRTGDDPAFVESPVWPFHANDEETVMETLSVCWADR